MVVSAKQPRRWGRLLQVGTSLVDDVVVVEVPGESPCSAGTPEADAALSRWLGAPVTLSRTVPEGARIHRLLPREAGMRPTWTAAVDGETVSGLSGARPGGRFVDFGAVHVVTTADLEQLRIDGSPDVQSRRFRPNLVLRLTHALKPGDIVRLERGVELVVTLPTPRCAVPGSAQPGLSAESAVLRAIGRRRTEIPGLGTAACVGVYADVLRPGVVHRGELAAVAS
jgi:hypothetical protein